MDITGTYTAIEAAGTMLRFTAEFRDGSKIVATETWELPVHEFAGDPEAAKARAELNLANRVAHLEDDAARDAETAALAKALAKALHGSKVGSEMSEKQRHPASIKAD